MPSPMPDPNLSKAVSNDDCDAPASHVVVASNKIATIAVRTAGATSPLSPPGHSGRGLLLRPCADAKQKPGANRCGRRDARLREIPAPMIGARYSLLLLVAPTWLFA